MKAGKYNYQTLFVNRYVEQLVIPEIQRDYVWQKPQVEGLLSSIATDFERFQKAEIPKIDSTDGSVELTQLNNDFTDFYRQRNHSSNIGFIYAYSDQQYDGRYFLIDGQQRITTLYLVLLLLAVRTATVADFEKKYCTNGQPKLDYRVRDSACSFIRQLVPHILKNSYAEIKDQYWYLNSYENDITVSNIISNIEVIVEWLESRELDESDFYLYLNNYTEFWYFDTNISAQGENLYIYLNARGEQMQGNENLKAELLSTLDSMQSKNEMGVEWENWQDLFWRMRTKGLTNTKIKGLNADKGFNEFLRCITGLTIYLDETASDWVDKQNSLIPSQAMLAQVLTLETIAKYINVLKFIENNQKSLNEVYSNFDWVNQFLHEFWSILNVSRTAWVIDYSYDRLSTERRRMVFIWGVFHWVDSALNAKVKFSNQQIFRGIRQFYLRYKNNVRSVTGDNGIKKSVCNLLETNFISSKSEEEEYQKERWLAEVSTQENWAELESLIWQIEDHPFNLDGSDVGLINSSHLIDFKETLTADKLLRIKDTFYMCFPPEKSKDKSKFPVMQSLLLHYGQFWRRKSPYYYENYQFNDWRNIIRSRTPHLSNNEFNIFFKELVESELTVDELLAEKRKHYVCEHPVSLLEQLLWYNNHLHEKMWLEGSHIALCEFYTKNDEDLAFNVRKPFLNTKGDFKGGNPRELYKLLPEDKRSY
jgi:hypothetical protein